MNCDNFMECMSRPSTRVHHAPGGKSSISFGGYDDTPVVRKENKKPAHVSATGKIGAPMPRAAPAESKTAPVAAPSAPVAASAPVSAPSAARATGISGSSNRFATGANQNCGNVLTDRPTSRVLAAPGGKSSMGSLLSWS